MRAWRRAGEEYLAILRGNPRSLWASLRLGALAMRRKRFAEAVGHYRAAAGIAFQMRRARRTPTIANGTRKRGQ